MFKAKAKVKLDGHKVLKAARKGSIQSLGHAGAAIRLAARRSIKKNKKASMAGSPPNTRKGRLRNAIKYALQHAAQSVVIGPDAAVAADSGKAHEFGGHYRRENYPRRPFMGPALEKIRPRLPGFWAGSIRP
jgi:phage gpG-like protein